MDTVVHQTEDPETVVAEFSSHGYSHATEKPYTFRALAVARVRDGRILLYEDYIDSIAMARMLGRTRELADALTSERSARERCLPAETRGSGTFTVAGSQVRP